jgi:hypothetical protein
MLEQLRAQRIADALPARSRIDGHKRPGRAFGRRRNVQSGGACGDDCAVDLRHQVDHPSALRAGAAHVHDAGRRNHARVVRIEQQPRDSRGIGVLRLADQHKDDRIPLPLEVPVTSPPGG